MIRIARTNLNFEREPMAAPWGFKGGFVTEAWPTVARMESESGKSGIGLGAQGVLWSDPGVFASCSEAAGNAMMFLLTSYALQAAKEIPFETPLDLLDPLLAMTYEYGMKVTGRPDLR